MRDGLSLLEIIPMVPVHGTGDWRDSPWPAGDGDRIELGLEIELAGAKIGLGLCVGKATL